MRRINRIIVHCSDSDLPSHDNIETIRQWHKARGFRDIGYHFVIVKNGDVFKGRAIEERGAHTEGMNADSLGICVTGRHYFSKEQFDSLKKICVELCVNLGIRKSMIDPHYAFNKNKTCPNFDLYALKKEWQI